MDLTEKFTAKELKDAAGRLSTTVETVLGRTDKAGPWYSWQLQTFAMMTGFNLVTLGRVIENASARKKEGDGTQEVIPAGVITAAELEDALQALQGHPGVASYVRRHDLADQIMQHAADRREPEYTPGTVVKDAAGNFYRRTSSGNWHMFATSHLFDHKQPIRPLEVL